MTKEYDPTKPFNEQTMATIQETWQAAEGNDFKVCMAGKRTIYTTPNMTMMDATDGIGTKALLHWRMYKGFGKNPRYAAQDAVAMVFDDLTEAGARPVRLQDHIIMEEENHNVIYELTRGLADICKEHGTVITGGETAICDNIRGFEMGITATGFIESGQPRVSQVRDGDALISLRSSGIHSNGLTFAREAYGLTMNKTDEELDEALGVKMPSGRTIGEELTIPTAIYCKGLLCLQRDEGVHGMVHITGGGWTKLRELDQTREFDFDVDGRAQAPHDIFIDMKKRSLEIKCPLDDRAMYRKFNCGTGFVVAVDPSYIDTALDRLDRHTPVVIGHAKKGEGRIRIQSALGENDVVF